MKSIFLLSAFLLSFVFQHRVLAAEFKPLSFQSFTQTGEIKAVDGLVNHKSAVEVSFPNSESVVVVSTGFFRTFDEAFGECKKLGEEWSLPTDSDAYAIGFYNFGLSEMRYEFDFDGRQIYPYWFLNDDGVHTYQNLIGTDKIIVFRDGGGPSGSPEVLSLGDSISQMEIPVDLDFIDSQTAFGLVLKAKLERGVPGFCLNGSLAD